MQKYSQVRRNVLIKVRLKKTNYKEKTTLTLKNNIFPRGLIDIIGNWLVNPIMHNIQTKAMIK